VDVGVFVGGLGVVFSGVFFDPAGLVAVACMVGGSTATGAEQAAKRKTNNNSRFFVSLNPIE
jgi:hypothetical protein